MPWGRIDDTYYDHPKLEELGDVHEWPDRVVAAGLNALAWSWCNRFLTDGKVPRATVSKLMGHVISADQAIALADQLVAVGLWEKAAGGYEIHDFLHYNDSREQVLARRQKEAARKAAYRSGKRPAGSPNGTSSVDDDDVPPVVPASVPVGQGDDVPPLSRAESRAESRRVSRDSSRARIPTRPDPSRPSDSPQPPASGGQSKRANGTSPRQLAAAAQAQADQEVEGKRYRRNQRQLAYARGAITEAQQIDMDRRDASLEEIPDRDTHLASLAAEDDWLGVKA